MSPPSPARRPEPSPRPEVLSPAGNWDCLRAAVENGADAVYFGLRGEFNARARAANFALDELPEVMDFLRRRGVKGYVAFNTLVFEDELAAAEDRLRKIAAAGADAVIVQDLGVARLARAVSPDLPIHASTQMTVTTAAGAEFAKRCGASRVILARELSVAEIAKVRAGTDVELEVFVHGALCVSYSGQCLTSEVWGGRSANRGECAQACRLPYDLLCDGERRDLGPIRYLISPKDLAAFDVLPELVLAGVAGFKIEGRLKTPEYVANVTRTYREALDRTLAGERPRLAPGELRDLEQSFSRGLSHGFLDGVNHQVLVEGRSPKKRGVLLGRVVRLEPRRQAAVVALEAPLEAGAGVVFEGEDPEAGEEGGTVVAVREWRGEAELRFDRVRGPDLAKVAVGCRVFKTKDPALDERLRATFAGERARRRAKVRFRAAGRAGEPLRVEAEDDRGNRASAVSAVPLAPAAKHALTGEVLREQLGRLGETIFALEDVSADGLEGALMLPISELNRLRRELVRSLEEDRARNPGYAVAAAGTAVAAVRADPSLAGAGAGAGADPQNCAKLLQSERVPDATISATRENSIEGGHPPRTPRARPRSAGVGDSHSPELSVLARTPAQAEAAIDEGVERIYLDFLELTGLRAAVEKVRSAGRKAVVATPRVEKPGEEPILRKLLHLEPFGVLARHLGAVEAIVRAREAGDRKALALLLVGDFSLNAANALTAATLLGRGLDLLTPCYDLNVDQLLALVERLPDEAAAARRLEIVLHQHLPMFHMEHCVFAAVLSPGTDYTNCGRPCDRHQVALRDPTGRAHPVLADVGCRNTVFNDRPQSAAEYLDRFLRHGLRRFRVELLEEDGRTARKVIARSRDALAGRVAPRDVFRELNAEGQFGVVGGLTRGTLPVVRG